MTYKDTYFVRIPSAAGDGSYGVGECALFSGLSIEDRPEYETWLAEACRNPQELCPYSSISFGLETALINAGYLTSPETAFTRGDEGVPINGLIWMGDRDEMRRRIDEKLDAGFRVLKMKIGGIDFVREAELLKYIRSRYSPSTLELRLDANGSFSPDNALERLKVLSDFSVHSLEQPVMAGQWRLMSSLCAASPIDIALDEELIGVDDRDALLDSISPAYIILKPALCGGIAGAGAWADAAESRGIGWWATSALESNVGLEAIARWVSQRGVSRPQGLGTGQLYFNNVESGLELRGDRLFCRPGVGFKMPELSWRH